MVSSINCSFKENNITAKSASSCESHPRLQKTTFFTEESSLKSIHKYILSSPQRQSWILEFSSSGSTAIIDCSFRNYWHHVCSIHVMLVNAGLCHKVVFPPQIRFESCESPRLHRLLQKTTSFIENQLVKERPPSSSALKNSFRIWGSSGRAGAHNRLLFRNY
ncbi:hypothetical protein CEXT_740861 [Caerostris extrusa]|uniref:Maturase K n=1 Tax=Caerostris extrusa TaxID=172846 RepID=A0AAV4XD07_CAEEX|nr:hypothetical protein CEXT_740861 [Caerostris extrusa]